MADKWQTSGRARLQAQRQNGWGAKATRRAAVTKADLLQEPPARPPTQKNHPLRPRKVAEGTYVWIVFL